MIITESYEKIKRVFSFFEKVGRVVFIGGRYIIFRIKAREFFDRIERGKGDRTYEPRFALEFGDK